MDRVISLLAALVGLIALGGAILVHTNVDAERRQMASDIAQMKVSIGLTSPQPAATPTPAPAQKPADDGTTDALIALQNRIAALEQVTSNQAVELDAARSALASKPAPLAAASSAELPMAAAIASEASSQPPQVADTASSVAPPASSASPAALAADGPTKDCIPLGTRFMASAGDSFPICKTHVVVKVAAVDDGLVTINGPGAVAAGGFAALDAKGCQVMVFSSDTSGYAEMRVTCQ